MKLTIKNVRLAYPQLFEAKSIKGGKPTFGASLLMAPNHPAVKEINKAIEAVAVEKWGKDAAGILKALRATDKVCLHNGDNKSGQVGFEGNLYVSANSKTRPTVIDRNRTNIEPDSGRIYAGCYVNAIVDIWAQQHAEHGKRINASLSGVQFYDNGDAFSGSAPAAPDDFDDLSEEATEAQFDPAA